MLKLDPKAKVEIARQVHDEFVKGFQAKFKYIENLKYAEIFGDAEGIRKTIGKKSLIDSERSLENRLSINKKCTCDMMVVMNTGCKCGGE
jgi:hypothetical protein